MQASADALAFTPPPEPAAVRGFVLAVIAHLILIVALSLSINWDKDTAPASVEAELWSALPQEAAPPPAPVPPPEPPKVVQAPPVVQPAPPAPVTKEPDIALEREKKRKEQEAAKRRQEEEERKELEAQKLQAQKQEAQKRKLEEQQRLAEEKKQREEQAKKDKAKQELDAKKREQLRKETLARLMAEASGNGSPGSQGKAARASGPSDSYAGRIRARVKPNIVFADDLPGNPSAEVEVRMSPDGTIVSRKITKSSGVQAWDDAVLRALDKTEVLPRDVDGRVHTPLIIAFKLRD